MLANPSVPWPLSHFHITSTYCGLTPVKHSILNVKALVGAFNQEKALVGAFSVIVKSSRTFVWSSSRYPSQIISRDHHTSRVTCHLVRVRCMVAKWSWAETHVSRHTASPGCWGPANISTYLHIYISTYLHTHCIHISTLTVSRACQPPFRPY